MLPSESQIKKARSVYSATRHLRLVGIPPLDYTDRISLLTIAGGLRTVGVLEGQGLQLPLVKDAVISHGLFTSVTKEVWTVREFPSAAPRANLLALLHRHHGIKRQAPRALWLFATREDRTRLKGVQLTKAAAGQALSYPACCVRASIDEDFTLNSAFLEALIAKVGEDPTAIERAIRDNVNVDLPDGLDFGSNVQKTTEMFPFLLHIPCDACFARTTSPSAKLNESYRSFILQVDQELHDAVLETSRLLTGFGELKDKSNVIARVEALHQSVFGT